MVGVVKKGISRIKGQHRAPSVKLNYVYNLIYQIFSLMIPLVTTPYLTNLLSASGIGQIGYIQTYSVYFGLFANLGFNYYSQRLVSACRNDKHKRSVVFYETLIARSVTTFASLMVYVSLASFSVYGKQYDTLVWIYVLPILAIFFDVSFYLTGIENFRTIVLRDTAIKIIGTALIFILVRKPTDVWAYGLILAATPLVSALFVLPTMLKEVERVSFKELHFAQHLRKSFLLFLPLAASSVYPYIDKTIIGLFVSDSEVGCYSKAEQITSTAAAFVTSLGIVACPRNSLLFAEGKKEQLLSAIYKAMNFIFIIGVPIFLGLIAIAPMMMGWYIKGTGFDNFILVMTVLSATIVTLGFRNVLGVQYLIPTKRDKQFAISVLCGLVLNIGLSTLFAFWFQNSIGVAIASLISELVICAALYACVWRELSLRKVFAGIWRYLIAGGVMFGLCYSSCFVLALTLVNTLLVIAVGAVAYFAILILLRDKTVLSVKETVQEKCEAIVRNRLYRKVAAAVFVGVVFLSVLSYSTVCLSIGLNKIVFVFWIALSFVLLPLFVQEYKKVLQLALIYAPFLVFTLLVSFTSSEKTITSTFVRLVFLSGYILMNGYAIGSIMNKRTVVHLSWAILLACVLASVNIFFAYFRDFSFSERIYRYSAKNEISCFILIAACLCSFLKPRRIFVRIAVILSFVFLVALLFMMKARAVIIVMPVLFVIELFNKRLSSNWRLAAFFIAMAAAILVFVIPPLRSIVIDQIILASRNPTSIDDISSNRFTYIVDAFEVFKLSPLIGVGSYYVDFGPVQLLASFGVAGTLLLIPAFVLPFYSYDVGKHLPVYFKRLFLLMLVVFYMNHLFEAYPPFGPGIKTFLLWFFCGIALNKRAFMAEDALGNPTLPICVLEI